MKTWTKSLIGSLLTLLGFHSCNPFAIIDQPDMYGPAPIDYPVCEYGVPSANYVFQGEAVNEENAPVQGIRIVVAPNGLENNYENDTLYTDAQGKASRQLTYNWPGTDALQVKFEDVDGPENGSYQELVLKNSELDIQKTADGSGNWYEGEFTIQAKAVLKKNTEEE